MKKFLIIVLIIITFVCGFYIGYMFCFMKTTKQIVSLNLDNNNLRKELGQSKQLIFHKNIDDNKHPIDIEEEKCISDSHVYGFPDCSKDAEISWNNEIKKNLNLLKNKMPKDEYKYIDEMNNIWSKSVSYQIDVINRFISNKDGIIYQTEGNNDIVQLKKQYAILLKDIYSNYYEE
jgi:hypothetical protein